MKSKIEGIGIKAISVAVPANVVDVYKYVQCRDANNIKRVVKKTGISSIRITKEGQTTSDLCFEAAVQLFKNGYDKNNICAIVFVSRTPDYISPPTSCILQARLGFNEEVLCYDSEACCYGYIAGLQLAGLLANLHNADVLLLTGDTNSKVVHQKDSACVMFGDGAAASVIGPVSSSSLEFHIRNNGNLAKISYIRDGGFRNSFNVGSLELKEDKYGNFRTNRNLHMHGLDMMNFVLNDASRLIQDTIMEYGKDHFDIFALHQANAMIVDSLSMYLSLPKEKTPVIVDGYGNISSASIPLVLSKMLYDNKSQERKKVLMAGYGGGASWGTAVTDLSETKFYPIVEVE